MTAGGGIVAGAERGGVGGELQPYLCNLFVTPDWQRKSVGVALVRAVVFLSRKVRACGFLVDQNEAQVSFLTLKAIVGMEGI